MQDDIDRLFNKTKLKFFGSAGRGFLATLLCKVEFRWDTTIPTAAINQHILMWNPDFFQSLDEDTRITVLGHELMHNAYMHGVRRGDRDPKIWNKAADYVINLQLKDDGFFMGGFPYLLDVKYKDMSTEAVYELLMDNAIKSPMGGVGSSGGSSGNSPADGQGESSGQDMSGDVLDPSFGAPEGASEESLIRDAVIDVMAAAQGAKLMGNGKNPGNIPGEITFFIEDFFKPIIRWEDELMAYMQAMSEKERSFARPSRRYSDIIMPGEAPDSGLEHLVYALDISGSITDEDIVCFNSEVKYIQEELRPARLTLITFDTRVHDIYEYELDDPFDGIEITGRGGTDLQDVYRVLHEYSPTAAVIFTDLEVHIPVDPGIPIIWCCTNNPSMTVPYGRLIHIDTTEMTK